MSFAQPAYLWLLLFLPLLIWLILQQRIYRHVVVPQLQLWLAGIRRHRWWDRWLETLARQCLAGLFCAVVLALAQPISLEPDPAFVVILDNSGSMMTQEAGATRWQQARVLAKEYLRQGRCWLVVTAPQPRLLPPTSLDSLTPDSGPGNPHQAIALATSLTGSGEQLVIITDGAGEEWPVAMETAKAWRPAPRIHVAGNTLENVGIKLREAYLADASTAILRVAVTNHGKLPVANRLAWRTIPDQGAAQEERLVAFQIAPGATWHHRLAVAATTPGKFEGRLQQPDALVLDDSVACRITPVPKARILVISDEPQPHLLGALAAYPQLIARDLSSIAQAIPHNVESHFDLVIVFSHELVLGSELELKNLAGNFLFWATHVPGLLPASVTTATDKSTDTVCWGVNSDHPVAQYLDLTMLQFETPVPHVPAKDLAVIAYGNNDNALIWEGQQGRLRYIYVGFSPKASSFPALPAFPLFIHNVILWATHQDRTMPLAVQQSDESESAIAPSHALSALPVAVTANRQRPWQTVCLWIALTLASLFAMTCLLRQRPG